MFEVSISLHPDTLNVLSNLASALSFKHDSVEITRPGEPVIGVPTVMTTANPIPSFTPQTTASAPMNAYVQPAPPSAAPTMTANTAPPPQQGLPVVPQPAWTLEAIFEMARQLVSQLGKVNEMNQLINGKYGVSALEHVPQERYAEIAADMMGLGAKPPMR